MEVSSTSKYTIQMSGEEVRALLGLLQCAQYYLEDLVKEFSKDRNAESSGTLKVHQESLAQLENFRKALSR